jgi:hypothetical protein
MARVDDSQPTPEHARFRHVVRHDDDRCPNLRLDAYELLSNLGAGDRVEGTKRFVHQYNRRVDGERARDTHSLSLSARQLVRAPTGEDVWWKTDEVQQLMGPRSAARGGPLLEAGDNRHVLLDSHMGKEADILNDVTDAPPQLNRVPVSRVAPFDHNRARGWHEEAIDQLEDGGLANAASTDNRQDFSRFRRQREVVQYGRAVGVPKADVFEPYEHDLLDRSR